MPRRMRAQHQEAQEGPPDCKMAPMRKAEPEDSTRKEGPHEHLAARQSSTPEMGPQYGEDTTSASEERADGAEATNLIERQRDSANTTERERGSKTRRCTRPRPKPPECWLRKTVTKARPQTKEESAAPSMPNTPTKREPPCRGCAAPNQEEHEEGGTRRQER
jgi:hypothetical protein